MLYILQYLAVICAFLLPWGVLGSIQAKKDSNPAKFRIYIILLAVSVIILGAVITMAFLF